MQIYTSEVEMLRAQCREWEKVCNSHLRLIKKLKKERTWVGLTDEEGKAVRDSVAYNPMAMTVAEWTQAVQHATETKLKEKNS